MKITNVEIDKMSIRLKKLPEIKVGDFFICCSGEPDKIEGLYVKVAEPYMWHKIAERKGKYLSVPDNHFFAVDLINDKLTILDGTFDIEVDDVSQMVPLGDLPDGKCFILDMNDIKIGPKLVYEKLKEVAGYDCKPPSARCQKYCENIRECGEFRLYLNHRVIPVKNVTIEL